jgi:hypothetical protein
MDIDNADRISGFHTGKQAPVSLIELHKVTPMRE